jgi:hypothetical protein
VGRFESYLFSFNEAIDKARWSFGAIRAARWAYRALVVAVIAFGVLRLARRFRRPEAARTLIEARPLLLAIAAYAVCMLVLLFVVGPMSLGERHTAGLLVPVMLALVAPAALLGRAAAQGWVAFLVVSNLAATTLVQIAPRAKDCDCRRVAGAIAAREAPKEPIVIFPSEDVMPLSVYYRGPNRLVPVPGPPSYAHWDQGSFVIRDPDDVGAAIDREAPDSVGLWVHTNTYGPHWGGENLEAFLARNYREEEKLEFAQGVVLRHFVRRADPSHSAAIP